MHFEIYSLKNHEELTADQKAWVREAHKATIIGEIQKLQAALEEYEALKNGEVTAPSLDAKKLD